MEVIVRNFSRRIISFSVGFFLFSVFLLFSLTARATTITWTNTSTPNAASWTRSISNGKITAPGGNLYWLHTGTTSVTQTAGGGTPLNLLDDVYSVTGNHTVTNSEGKSRTATVTEALEKKTICHNVTKGKLKIEGPNHFAIIDYGDGTCDNIVTISIDGRTPRTITLP